MSPRPTWNDPGKYDYAERVFLDAENCGDYLRSGRAVLNTQEAAFLRQLQTEEFVVVGAYEEECGGVDLPALKTELIAEMKPLVLKEYGFQTVADG